MFVPLIVAAVCGQFDPWDFPDAAGVVCPDGAAWDLEFDYVQAEWMLADIPDAELSRHFSADARHLVRLLGDPYYPAREWATGRILDHPRWLLILAYAARSPDAEVRHRAGSIFARAAMRLDIESWRHGGR